MTQPLPTESDALSVTLWRINLDVDDAAYDACRRILDAEECTRAERFQFYVHRRRFVARRAAYRQILGRLADAPAEDLHFTYGSYGKAELQITDRRLASAFNSTHSGERAVLAVGSDARLGVDIELIRAEIVDRPLVERILTAAERESFESLPPAIWPEILFRIWSRKEALLKATGLGLSREPSTLDVWSPDDGDLVQTGKVEGTEWWLSDLTFWPGYAACLAADRQITRIEVRDWSWD